MSDIVCIGAHPDDVEIGMGATIAKLVAQGLSVTIVDLTDGEPTPFGTRELRLVESLQAAAVLGAARITMDLPNRELFDTVEARYQLAEILRELRPQRIFVPYPEDAHPDHVAASDICLAARFWAKFTKTTMRGEPFYPPSVYRYRAVHLKLIEQPSFIHDVTGFLAVKMEALASYKSQFESNPLSRSLLAQMESGARMWGSLIGVEAGEPFYAIESVGLRDIASVI
ncbi:MAG: PIG-L family deacetylase [Actinobacteria bacterium]|nr:PIG-L family deacetylase [Actinomycetota bacterium]